MHIYLQLRGENMMMMAGGVGAAVDHNGIYSNPNLHSLQQTEADNPDSRKRPLETPLEEAGCTKRTNTGGKRHTEQEAAPCPLHTNSDGVVVEAFACTGASSCRQYEHAEKLHAADPCSTCAVNTLAVFMAVDPSRV